MLVPHLRDILRVCASDAAAAAAAAANDADDEEAVSLNSDTIDSI